MILTDSFWLTYSDYIVGVPTFIFASLFAYWIYLKQKTQKRLGYNVVANSRLTEIHNNYKDKFKVYFDNIEVNNVSVIFVWIKNVGTEPIESNDFYTPITVKFTNEANVLSAEIVSRKPEDLQLTVEINNNEVTLEPTLLNSTEAFLLKLIVDSINTNLSITCRISGVKHIEKGIKVDDHDPRLSISRKIHVAMIAITTIIFLLYFPYAIINHGFEKDNYFELAIFLLTIPVWFSELNYLYKRKYE